MNAVRNANHRSGTSLAKVYEYMVKALQEGDLVPGQYLPSLRDLAEQFQISRAPVHQAILRLEREGLVRRLHGRGVEVVRSTPAPKERLKPLVQIFAPLHHTFISQRFPSVFSHRHTAVDEWLVWYLGHEKPVRMQTAFWRDEEEFMARLEECLQSPPGVIVFAKPEELSQKMIDLLQQLQQQGVAVVHQGNRMEVQGLDCARADFLQGQYDLTRRVIADGGRRLLRFQLAGTWNFEICKENGYRLALQESSGCCGFTLDAPAFGVLHVEESEMAELRTVIADAVKRLEVDTILALNDAHAAMVRIALLDLKASHIRVTGYDAVWHEMDWSILFAKCNPDYAKAAQSWISPLSVDKHMPEVALALSRLAVNRALGKLPHFPQMTLIPTALVEEGAMPTAATAPSAAGPAM
ncbi:MAG: winged helix-turn-helix domain-containing protein [Candidatus Methylacidiphilales bacterium]|nr:winged helix-turn-helix domain-containing protein [Candidatus Methylacidiphilales bacterium]